MDAPGYSTQLQMQFKPLLLFPLLLFCPIVIVGWHQASEKKSTIFTFRYARLRYKTAEMVYSSPIFISFIRRIHELLRAKKR